MVHTGVSQDLPPTKAPSKSRGSAGDGREIRWYRKTANRPVGADADILRCVKGGRTMVFRPCSKRNILVCASLALLASLLFVSSAWAIETRGGQNVTIDADEVSEDDLYVGAETVRVEGTVRGDLVAAGGTVRMNGTVEGDISSAGQTGIVNGTVEDDVRIAGQALLIGEDAQITDRKSTPSELQSRQY